MDKIKRLVLIDGHALLHRAYHAYPKTLTTTKGELVNAVYGFTSNLFSIFRKLHPEYVAVAFDLKGPTFRHHAFKDYKWSRPKVDEELLNQINRVKQVVKMLNIPIFEISGYEADDVIGTLTRQATKTDILTKTQPSKADKKLEVVIATGDRDTLQLVGKKVKVYFPGRGRLPAQMMDEKTFRGKYGFAPELLVDYKALAGDASDDIPGVRGIGPKKATLMVKKFGTIENLYKQLDKYKDLNKAMLKMELAKTDIEKLKQSREQAFLSKKLALIVTDVPIRLKLPACKLTDYDKGKARKLFKELEFRTLISRLPGMEEKKVTKRQKEQKTKPSQQQMGLF